jgi:hypothetical protein
MQLQKEIPAKPEPTLNNLSLKNIFKIATKKTLKQKKLSPL